jgi:D-lactate dehydrogenase
MDDSHTRLNDLVADITRRIGSGAILTDPADRWTYGYDNSKRQELPAVVTLPSSHEEVVQIVTACNGFGVPLTVRGRGTGTTGAAVPAPGGVVLSTERMDRILRIDPGDRVAVVQAGVTNGALQSAAGEHGFFWPPDPTSADYCSIGGNLGCNAAGPRAVKYGTPRDNTLGLRAVAGDGTSLRTGCYTTKGVVGYDLTRLLIGSEGTLAVITEATLLLTPASGGISTLRIIYRDMVGAAAAVGSIMAQPCTPRALEYMDGGSIRLIREISGHTLPESAGAMLLVEVDGTVAVREDAVDSIRRAADNPSLLEFAQATDADETNDLWAARKALSPSLRKVAPKKINEDVVVPVSRMAELVNCLERLAEAYRITIVSFGHAGNGNIHVNLLGDPDKPGEKSRMEECLGEVFRAVLDLGGTLSGEHGVGIEKRPYVGLEIEPATLAMMWRIKRQFDPAGILNPGKSLPEPVDTT